MQQHARNRKATTPARMEAGRNDASGRKRQPAGQRSTTLMVRAGLAIAAFSLGLFSGEYLWPRQADNLAPIANDHARKVHISGGVAWLDVLETEGGQLRETAYQAAGAAQQQLPRVGSLRRETSKINGNAGSLPEAHTNAGEASGAVKAKASLVDLVQKIETRHTNAIPAEEVASPGGTARKTPTSSNLDAAVRDINALPVPSKVGGKVEAVFEADTITSSISEWNGHHAAYSLTLDDGSDGMITFAPMTMNEFGIKGTYFITPQFVDAPKDSPKPAQLPNKWPHIVRLAAAGHEVGAHTTSHRNFGMENNQEFTRKDFSAVIKRLEKEVPSWAGADFTMAYPFGGRNQMSTEIASNLYIGARTTTCKSMRSTEFTSEFSFANIFGCEYGKGANAGTVNKIFDRAVDESAWVVSLAHGLGSCVHDKTLWEDDRSPENYGEGIRNKQTGERVQCRYGYSWLEPGIYAQHIAYVAKQSKEKDVWVETMGNVAKYIRQKNAYETKARTDGTSIVVSLSKRAGYSGVPRLPRKMVPITIEIRGTLVSKYATLDKKTSIRVDALGPDGKSLPTDTRVDGSQLAILIRGVELPEGGSDRKVVVKCYNEAE